ncbi:MAG: Rid family hydrolase [Pseudomonadota bacterium]
MTIETFKSGGRFEEIGAYARAKRVGPFVYIAGTTAIEPSGKLHAPDDCYEQSLYIFKRIEEALAEVGAEMRHVVRTRAFFADMAGGGAGYVRAHGEVFKGIGPVTSGVEAGLNQPGMMVEIEADAVITDDEGRIRLER